MPRVPRGISSFILLALSLLEMPPAAGQTVQPRAEMDHAVVLAGLRQPVYVLVEFDVAKVEAQAVQERPQMNIGLVLDRSGSMDASGKMEYAKKAARIVVDRLTPADRLAVVEYDNQVTVLWPSSPVEAPEMIKRRIDGLTPRGGTDLTGGMMKGVEQVLENLDRDGINRVLLLSDGMANHGITHPERIARLVREARQRGVAISTMGLGLQYNEDLMQAIAENAGGHYYYIENPVQMARIFQQEMEALFTTVAKEVKIVFVGSQAVEQVEVFGFRSEASGPETRIPMEDFYAGEKRSLLLRLEVNPLQEGKIELGKLEFSYLDPLDGRFQRMVLELVVTASADSQQVDASRNERVIAGAALIEADKRHEEYVRLYEQGRKAEAQGKITTLADELTDRNVLLKDVQLAKKIEALRMEEEEMTEAELDQASRADYLKKSKLRAYHAQKGQRGKYLLQEGDEGYDVERLQEALLARQLYQGPVDGRFGTALVEAVKAFQRQDSLTVDGVAGPRTMKALQLY
jgi:Ca-activated chloride channel homolog